MDMLESEIGHVNDKEFRKLILLNAVRIDINREIKRCKVCASRELISNYNCKYSLGYLPIFLAATSYYHA